jgi:hypothetical protein
LGISVSRKLKHEEQSSDGENMAQIENIEALEKRLWGSADTLRANSNYASNEYFMPVMGLMFLRQLAVGFCRSS